MLETSARLLRLLSLLQSRRFWSGSALAAQLAVTERTVRRDVDRLRTLGYPVHATSGVAGGYRLGAGAALPPLLLDDDEALAVSLGLRLATTSSVKGMEEATLRALTKLEQVMPSHLRRRVAGLHGAIVPMQLAGPTVDAEVLAKIASAARNCESLHFRYGDIADKVSERRVEPLGLVHTGARWYLLAWDKDREALRTFRVDRASKLTVGARFPPRPLPEEGLASYVSRSISTEVYSQRARLLLHSSRKVAAQRISPSAGRLEELDAQRCILHTGAESFDRMALHLGLLGLDFEVLEPPELLTQLRELHQRFGRTLEAATRPEPTRVRGRLRHGKRAGKDAGR